MNTTPSMYRQQAMRANFALMYGTPQNWAVDFHREYPFTMLGRRHPDLHGGAKRFYRQFVAWTRDLKPLGHDFIRVGPRIFCSRCRFEVQKWACGKGGRAPHKLRTGARSMIQRLGSCDTLVVTAVMES